MGIANATEPGETSILKSFGLLGYALRAQRGLSAGCFGKPT